MLKRFALPLGLFVFLGLPAQAQNYPRAEIFGGFSYLNADGGIFGRQNAFGWQASVSGNVHKNVGIVGDFGGQYKDVSSLFLGLPVTARATEYLFGPRFTYRHEKASVFAHALFGDTTASLSLFGVSVSESAFAMAFGGGVDANVSDLVAIRAIQFDYLQARKSGLSLQNVRLGFGVVFKLGGS